MSEAEQCGATLGAYLDPGPRKEAWPLTWGRHTAENPARGRHFFGLCNHARDRGHEVTFVVEGPNAAEAAGRVRRLLGKPLRPQEVGSKTALWVTGTAAKNAPSGRYERAELAAVLPGEHGFECIFYSHMAARTVRLRREVYVTVVAEGEEFRPSGFGEHFPTAELGSYQAEAGRLAGTGEEAFGKGRSLEVTFVCYSPPGSGAAEEAIGEIRAALEDLREVATWPDRKRSWFGLRHNVGAAAGMVSDATHPPYRPPEGVLSHRSHAPEPAGPKTAPVAQAGPTFRERLEAQVDHTLRAWGHADVADEMKRGRKKPDRAPAPLYPDPVKAERRRRRSQQGTWTGELPKWAADLTDGPRKGPPWT